MIIGLVKDITDDDWMLVKRIALSTMGKTPVTPPTHEWKERMLMARHSPVRELHFVFLLKDIPYWVSVHLCRHVHAQPYVLSQRNDRQSEYDRNKAPQDAPVTMYWSMNAEELMNIANKRLCMMASKETRDIVMRMCSLVREKHPEFNKVLVANCIAHGSKCYEIKPCGMFGSA